MEDVMARGGCAGASGEQEEQKVTTYIFLRIGSGGCGGRCDGPWRMCCCI